VGPLDSLVELLETEMQEVQEKVEQEMEVPRQVVVVETPASELQVTILEATVATAQSMVPKHMVLEVAVARMSEAHRVKAALVLETAVQMFLQPCLLRILVLVAVVHRGRPCLKLMGPRVQMVKSASSFLWCKLDGVWALVVLFLFPYNKNHNERVHCNNKYCIDHHTDYRYIHAKRSDNATRGWVRWERR
jgi:hypothetical protein